MVKTLIYFSTFAFDPRRHGPARNALEGSSFGFGDPTGFTTLGIVLGTVSSVHTQRFAADIGDHARHATVCADHVLQPEVVVASGPDSFASTTSSEQNVANYLINTPADPDDMDVSPTIGETANPPAPDQRVAPIPPAETVAPPPPAAASAPAIFGPEVRHAAI